MAEQDRSRWDASLIAEGVALITGVLGHVPTGPYQLQAAIAAIHDEAPARPGRPPGRSPARLGQRL